MRTAQTLLLLLLISTTSSAQPPSGPPTTITGCLMSMNGAFALTTANGDRYILKGAHDRLFSYNGAQVQVTGTPKATKKGAAKHEFQVTDIKKIADVCQ